MLNEKSTYQKFEAFQSQVLLTVFAIIIGAYLVICARNFIVSPETIKSGLLLQSEEQAFKDGMNRALNQ